MNKRYTVNMEEDTITYIHDHDTGEHTVMQLGDVVELLAWLKYRETDLRRLVFLAAQVDIRQPFRLINGYYVGTCDDRRKVKVPQLAMENMLKSTEQRVRSNWVYDRKEKAQYRAGPVLISQLDREGREMFPPDETVTESDTPDFIVQDALYRIRQPEFWCDRPENMSLGRYEKTL